MVAVMRCLPGRDGVKLNFNLGGEMDTYIGTKIIKACFMNLGDYNKLRGWTIPEDEDPTAGGYLVGYPGPDGKFDGDKQEGCHYISWSPADVFEASYTPITGMSFGQALEALKIGKSVRLPQWQEDVKIKAQFPDDNSKMTAPYLYVESRFGMVPWEETMIELFSDDWEIVA